MRRIIALLTLSILNLTVFCQNFYDIENINTIEISFTEPNWDNILDALYANDIEKDY